MSSNGSKHTKCTLCVGIQQSMMVKYMHKHDSIKYDAIIFT